MKTGILLVVFLIPFYLLAQNVGVGTSTPSQKLEVMNALRSTVKISSGSYNDTTELQFSNLNPSSQGTSFAFKSMREEGLYLSSSSDLPQNNSANSFVVKPSGFIGLNDPNPAARLTISGNEATASGLGAAVKIQNTASTNAWYLRAGAAGTITPNGGFSIADNGTYHFIIDPSGDIGIGMNPSGARLHVNGGIKIQTTNILELGAGVAGKELNAGKIAYNGFGTTALAIVGAGTNTTNRAVYFFAEGGATFTGPVNIQGTIQVNGNPGSTGQVLSSNGTGDPVWRNASFSNSTRFGIRVTENAAKSGTATISGTYYNLDPANIVIGASTITFNRSGLYHFDMGANGNLSFATATTATPTMGAWLFFGLPNAVQLVDDKLMIAASSANSSYRLNEKVSVEVYITAPATISFYHTFNTLGVGGGASTHNLSGFLTGHLIAD